MPGVESGDRRGVEPVAVERVLVREMPGDGWAVWWLESELCRAGGM